MGKVLKNKLGGCLRVEMQHVCFYKDKEPAGALLLTVGLNAVN